VTPDDPSPPPKSGVSNLDVKARFASNVFRLSGMELGHVLHVIDLKYCILMPSYGWCRERYYNYDEAQVEINIERCHH
jgi:hypothetical protein